MIGKYHLSVILITSSMGFLLTFFGDYFTKFFVASSKEGIIHILYNLYWIILIFMIDI